MWTYEYDYDFKENCTLKKKYKDSVHKSNQLIANDGYVLSDINEFDEVLEDGTIIPKVYYRSVQSTPDETFDNYIAVLEEEGMDIAGVTDEPEVM